MRRSFAILPFVFIVLIAYHPVYATSLCDSIADIKILPFKNEPVDDEAYNALIKAGEAAVPCLITNITDTRKMGDPRQAPTYDDVRVGDVAYFVLLDISKIDLAEMLPPEVQKQYKADGVYAYFKFVEKKNNRKWLQDRLRDRFSKNQIKDRI